MDATLRENHRNADGDAASRRIIWIGAGMNFALSGMKFAVGFLSGSASLVADAAHSLSDLVTDAVALIGIRIAGRPVDADHPYGHGKFETIAALAISVLLVAAGAGIVVEAFRKPASTAYHPGWAAGIALVSVLVKEILFQLTRRVARRVHSAVLLANAWHHRSDAASSVAVFIATGLEFAGIAGGDRIAAALIGGMIALVGINLFWTNLRQLSEAAADEKTLATIREQLTSTPRVLGFHRLRTRFVGKELFVDVHVLVDPELTVTDGHEIATGVERAIENGLPFPANALVHIEPYREGIRLDGNASSSEGTIPAASSGNQ